MCHGSMSSKSFLFDRMMEIKPSMQWLELPNLLDIIEVIGSERGVSDLGVPRLKLHWVVIK